MTLFCSLPISIINLSQIMEWMGAVMYLIKQNRKTKKKEQQQKLYVCRLLIQVYVSMHYIHVHTHTVFYATVPIKDDYTSL